MGARGVADADPLGAVQPGAACVEQPIERMVELADESGMKFGRRSRGADGGGGSELRSRWWERAE